MADVDVEAPADQPKGLPVLPSCFLLTASLAYQRLGSVGQGLGCSEDPGVVPRRIMRPGDPGQANLEDVTGMFSIVRMTDELYLPRMAVEVLADGRRACPAELRHHVNLEAHRRGTLPAAKGAAGPDPVER